jgi:predicted porin
VATTGNDLSTKGWSLGVNAPVGAFNVLASLGQVKLGSAKAQKFAIGGVYNLSKRTAAYATLARVSNSGGASIAANSYGSGALGPVTGSSNVNGNSTGFDIGLRMAF